MSNGSIFREIKEALKDDPDSITSSTLNRLVLEGIIGLKDELDSRPIFSMENMDKLSSHEVRIKNLEEKMSTLMKIFWIVITPLLLAIGAGVVALIRLLLILGTGGTIWYGMREFW